MCPFACCARGSGPTVLKALVIAATAATVGSFHWQLSPALKLVPDPPPPIEPLLAKPAPVPATNPGTAKANDPAPAADKPKPAAQTPKVVEQAPVNTAKPVPAKPHDASMLTLEQVKELHARIVSTGDVAFVDARNPDEFATGRIPAAVNLPPSAFFSGQVPAELDQIPRSSILVVYCNGGDCDASKLTAIRLREQGYEKVYIYEDGVTGWKAAGLQFEK